MLYLCSRINKTKKRLYEYNKYDNPLPDDDSCHIADEHLRDGAKCGVGTGEVRQADECRCRQPVLR